MSGLTGIHVPVGTLALAGLFSFASASSSAASSGLVYACYPNATLLIQNPGGYQGAFANNSNTICNTTFMHNKMFLYITNCPVNVSISVSFANNSEINTGILGGKRPDDYLITCNQLPANGVFWNVSSSLDVDHEEHNQSMVYPLYNLTSDILMFDYAQGILYMVDSAVIGDELVWLLFVARANYTIRPEECTAYAGNDLSAVTNETSRKVITLLGCSTDSQLTDDFLVPSSETQIAYSSLRAFRFFESEFITIECDVRICPYASGGCNITCPVSGRRKRDVPVSLDADVMDSTVMRTKTTIRIPLNSASKENIVEKEEIAHGSPCVWTIPVILTVALFKLFLGSHYLT